ADDAAGATQPVTVQAALAPAREVGELRHAVHVRGHAEDEGPPPPPAPERDLAGLHTGAALVVDVGAGAAQGRPEARPARVEEADSRPAVLPAAHLHHAHTVVRDPLRLSVIEGHERHAMAAPDQLA